MAKVESTGLFLGLGLTGARLTAAAPRPRVDVWDALTWTAAANAGAHTVTRERLAGGIATMAGTASTLFFLHSEQQQIPRHRGQLYATGTAVPRETAEPPAAALASYSSR